MHNRLLAATALSTLVLLVPGAVLAQDAGYDWSGFYAGFNAGVVNSTATFDNDAGTFGFPATLDLPSLTTTGGVQAGYNLQSGRFVYGLEGDANVLGADKSVSDGYDVRSSLDSLLSLRARFGVTFDRMMVYATAGVATGHASFSSDTGKGSSTPASANGMMTGSIVGAGVEYAVSDKVSMKVEGAYYNLGSLSGVGDTGKGAEGSPAPYTANYHAQGAIFTTGLNLHF